MPEAKNPAKRPGASGPGGAPKKPGLPGQPGQQPGDEWGEDNPGNHHGVGVDDHVFFHRDGAGPHAGRVVCHGVHGCQVEDDGGARHKVRWSRVLGLKKRAVHEGQVVDRGEAGAIVEHKDGRRVFVAGDLAGAGGVPEGAPRFRDLAGLEDAGRQPPKRRISDLEEFARHSSDLTKALTDHECEGPALCRVCAGRRERAGIASLVKSFAPGLQELEQRVAQLRSRGAGSRPLPKT
jgi:hypothetical protein